MDFNDISKSQAIIDALNALIIVALLSNTNALRDLYHELKDLLAKIESTIDAINNYSALIDNEIVDHSSKVAFGIRLRAQLQIQP